MAWRMADLLERGPARGSRGSHGAALQGAADCAAATQRSWSAAMAHRSAPTLPPLARPHLERKGLWDNIIIAVQAPLRAPLRLALTTVAWQWSTAGLAKTQHCSLEGVAHRGASHRAHGLVDGQRVAVECQCAVRHAAGAVAQRHRRPDRARLVRERTLRTQKSSGPASQGQQVSQPAHTL